MELKPARLIRSYALNHAFNRTLWNWNAGRTGPVVCCFPPFNRTLWNWNWCSMWFHQHAIRLLIVPYGIETPAWRIVKVCVSLLIVPYGIETLHGNRRADHQGALLIVPYGIETTFVIYIGSDGTFLLIVPYGIETDIICQSAFTCMLLIVPYGIETLNNLQYILTKQLLIVPYGIETALAPTLVQKTVWSFNRTLWNWNYRSSRNLG